MEKLPALGTAIMDVLGPTERIYEPLLLKNEASILSTLRNTFAYGPNPRHNLDVYYPASSPTGADCPILMFIYGGGLMAGSRILPDFKDGLVYANLGYFFAEKYGYVVVVPDYRLLPEASFPSGGEDVSLVVNWIISNPDEFGGFQQSRDLFMMGNSAGGLHLSTYLFYDKFAETREHILLHTRNSFLRLKAVVFVAVPYHFRSALPERFDSLTTYYGNNVDELCPLGLFTTLKAANSVSKVLPNVRFLNLTGSLDPEDEIVTPARDFVLTWRARMSPGETELEADVMIGHNHASPFCAVGTAIPAEEAWADEVAAFCKKAVLRENWSSIFGPDFWSLPKSCFACDI